MNDALKHLLIVKKEIEFLIDLTKLTAGEIEWLEEQETMAFSIFGHRWQIKNTLVTLVTVESYELVHAYYESKVCQDLRDAYDGDGTWKEEQAFYDNWFKDMKYCLDLFSCSLILPVSSL